MSTSDLLKLNNLFALESQDYVVQIVAKRIRTIFVELGIDKKIPGLQIFFPDFKQVQDSTPKPPYYTDGCMSILPSTIIVNARFLVDTESAIRAFGMFETLFTIPYLRADSCLFALVKRIREDGPAWLEKLRQYESTTKASEHHMLDEITLTFLFFCAHEAGHLLDKQNAAQFATFLNPDEPLEERLANASIKLRRHALDFDKYGFDLPGWQAATQPEADVYQTTEKLRVKIESEDKRNEKWFQKEISADTQAVSLITAYLQTQPKKYSWLLVNGLFAVAMYTWYRDLLSFCEKLDVPRMGPNMMFSIELMRNPAAYINAASLYGDIHRCTFLRSTISIQEILNAQIDDQEAKATAAANNKVPFLKWVENLWVKLLTRVPDDEYEAKLRSGATQRHVLLAIHMDTVVKFAYVGASMPFIQMMAEKRGTPQLMMVNFESIGQSMARLKQTMGA